MLTKSAAVESNLYVNDDIIPETKVPEEVSPLAEESIKLDGELTRAEQLEVLKSYQRNLPIESDFQYVVEGARGFNDFGRTNEESVTQIEAIRERFESETDPLKKYACKIQLEICEKFLEEKRKLMPDLMTGENWKKYLEDKRGIINLSKVKFVVNNEYKTIFIKKWQEANQKVQTALSRSEGKYDPNILKPLIVDRVVAMAVEAYIENAKFGATLNPLTRNDL